jgi:hypothetical protein
MEDMPPMGKSANEEKSKSEEEEDIERKIKEMGYYKAVPRGYHVS